jgi:hypothetical protein
VKQHLQQHSTMQLRKSHLHCSCTCIPTASLVCNTAQLLIQTTTNSDITSVHLD